MAAATLFCNGGTAAVLRMPGQAVSGSDAEQLGLATPTFNDVPLGPAVWRRTGQSTELIVAAESVAALIATTQMGSAEALFTSAVGVLVDGVLYVVESCDAVGGIGTPAGYRLGVSGPTWV